jgi:hypothetical protein
MPDDIVATIGLALAEAHDEQRGKGDSPAADAYRTGSCAVGYWDALVQAATDREELVAEVERLRDALRLFIDDERFQVTMGGNPIVVERAIAQAHAALKGNGNG